MLLFFKNECFVCIQNFEKSLFITTVLKEFAFLLKCYWNFINKSNLSEKLKLLYLKTIQLTVELAIENDYSLY